MEWTHNIIDSTNIDRSRIELEITERVINKESEKINKRLEYLRKLGYKIYR